MEDKLNRHNDPTGLIASLKSVSGPKPYLGDISVIERIIRTFSVGVLERYDEVGHGVLTPADAANADGDECLRMGKVFAGQDNAYTPVADWSGSGLANFLRDEMEREIPEEQDDARQIASAFGVLVHGIYDVLRQVSQLTEEDIQTRLTAQIKPFARLMLGVGRHE